MGDGDTLWKAKVAAFVHDPPEKALVLGCGKGHERGTVSTLCGELFGTDAIPDELDAAVREADRWASAADRPDRPRAEKRFSAWESVRFPERPVLVNPLSGEKYDLEKLDDVDPAVVERFGTEHLREVISRGDPGHRAVFHRLWRLGPETQAEEIRSLWRLLPADTRVPDHSIWDHLVEDRPDGSKPSRPKLSGFRCCPAPGQ